MGVMHGGRVPPAMATTSLASAKAMDGLSFIEHLPFVAGSHCLHFSSNFSDGISLTCEDQPRGGKEGDSEIGAALASEG